MNYLLLIKHCTTVLNSCPLPWSVNWLLYLFTSLVSELTSLPVHFLDQWTHFSICSLPWSVNWLLYLSTSLISELTSLPVHFLGQWTDFHFLGQWTDFSTCSLPWSVNWLLYLSTSLVSELTSLSVPFLGQWTDFSICSLFPGSWGILADPTFFIQLSFIQWHGLGSSSVLEIRVLLAWCSNWIILWFLLLHHLLFTLSTVSLLGTLNAYSFYSFWQVIIFFSTQTTE